MNHTVAERAFVLGPRLPNVLGPLDVSAKPAGWRRREGHSCVLASLGRRVFAAKMRFINVLQQSSFAAKRTLRQEGNST